MGEEGWGNCAGLLLQRRPFADGDFAKLSSTSDEGLEFASFSAEGCAETARRWLADQLEIARGPKLRVIVRSVLSNGGSGPQLTFDWLGDDEDPDAQALGGSLAVFQGREMIKTEEGAKRDATRFALGEWKSEAAYNRKIQEQRIHEAEQRGILRAKVEHLTRQLEEARANPATLFGTTSELMGVLDRIPQVQQLIATYQGGRLKLQAAAARCATNPREMGLLLMEQDSQGQSPMGRLLASMAPSTLELFCGLVNAELDARTRATQEPAEAPAEAPGAEG